MSAVTIRINKNLEAIQVQTPGGQMAIIHLSLGNSSTKRGIIDAIQAICAEAQFEANIILE